MKALTLFAPRIPWPALSGGEIRVATMLRALARGWDVELVYPVSSPSSSEEAAAALLMEKSWGLRPRPVRRAPDSRGRAPAGWPSWAKDFYDSGLAAAVGEAADAGRLVLLEFSQMAPYAAAVAGRAPVILTEHDSGVLSLFSSYLRPRSGGWPATVADWWRGRRLLRGAYAACSRVIALSEADARRLRAFCPEARVEIVPTGVDVSTFSFRGLEDRQPGLVAFVGHYPHFPNEDAAVALCREVFPPLSSLVPGARVRLVGSSPTPTVAALAGAAVEVTGSVADVRPHLWQARAFVAPLRLGRGIKGKILEAFACGTPVAATSSSVEALPDLVDGRHCLVADGSRALARAAARLLSDDVLAARLAENARRYVEERFDWPALTQRFDAICRRALAESPP